MYVAHTYAGLLSSDAEFDEVAVFKETYASLCNTIVDINELLKYFVVEKIITLDQQEEIKTCATKSERISKLLLNISGPLEAGDSKGFYTMLKILKTHGVDATQRLANQIIMRVDKSKLPNLVNTGPVNSIPKGWTKGLLLYCNYVCKTVHMRMWYVVCKMYTYPYTYIRTYGSKQNVNIS